MQNEIDKLKNVELEILQVFHDICEENDFKYSLMFGTLLGAVRHKGFIPWDDDIDVMMPREDYEKFRLSSSIILPSNYLLQDYHNCFDTCNNFAQLKKDKTILINYESERTSNKHKGIKIDIFPADRVPKGVIKRKLQYNCAVLNLLFSRGYVNEKSSLISKAIQRILLLGNKKHYFKRADTTEAVLRKWSGDYSLELACFDVLEDCKKYFPADIFDKTLLSKFEGYDFRITSEYDKVLKTLYGQYMLLPPAEERVNKHHPLIIDFSRNYEDI